MLLFLGYDRVFNLPGIISVCKRNEPVELQSAELLWALLGTIWLVLAVGSGQAGVCVGAFLLP